MLVRPVGKKKQLPWNRGFLVARKSLSSQSTFGPKRWTVGDGSFRRPTRIVPDITYRPLKFFNKIRQERSFLSAQQR